MSTLDAEYLERRAEAEIALAQRATDERVVKAHYELATHYLDRLHGDDAAPTG
jgi:hypothetical protein